MVKYKHLLVISFLIAFLLATKPSFAELSGWAYRIPIVIDNSYYSRYLSYYQVPIILDGKLMSSIDSLGLRSDCGDIRFTDSDGTTLLNYWIRKCGYVTINVNAYYSTGTTCVSDMNVFPDTPNSYGTNDWYIYDPLFCDNCDQYVRIYLNLNNKPDSVKIEIVSDDGQRLWVNGITVGGCGGGCHGDGTCARTWDITPYIYSGNNEIRIWCSERAGDEYCKFRLFVNELEIRRNGVYTAAGESEVVVKVPDIQANSKKTIYLYFGNPTATSMSNGYNTFDFFDDFSQGLGRWSVPSTNWFIRDGVLVFNGTGEERMLTSTFSATDFVLEYDERWVRNNDTGVVFRAQDTNNFYFFRTTGITRDQWELFKTVYNSWSRVAYGYNIKSPRMGEWYENKVVAFGNRLSLYYNERALSTYTDTSNPFLSGKIGFRVVNGEYHYDNVRVRRYVYPEPVPIVGEIERIGAPKIEISKPLDTYTYASGEVQFIFRATDDDSPTFRLTAYLDGSIIYDNIVYLSGTLVTVTRNLVDERNYNFTVVAVDRNGITSVKTSIFGISYLPDWLYSREVNIDNTGNFKTLINHPVKILINTKKLISEGKMRSDCGDMRFLDSDRKQFLHYWIERGCGAEITHVWVKIPEIPANSIKKIYFYYGNTFAYPKENGSAVFIFFDDFSLPYVDENKWYISFGSTGDAISISGGYLRIYTDNSATTKSIQSRIGFSDNFIVEFKAKHSVSSGSLGFGIVDYSRVDEFGLFLLLDTGKKYNVYMRYPGVFVYDGSAAPKYSTDVEYFYKIVVKGNNVTFYRDNFPIYREVNLPMRNLKYIIAPRAWDEWTTDSGEIRIDYIFVRKYEDVEPKVEALVDLPQVNYVHLFVPNSGSFNSISEVDITNPYDVREVGRHYTVPYGYYGNPSRTAVDYRGYAWVGNRGTNSLVKVGSVIGGTCVDRNGNGVIDTGKDLNKNGVVDDYEMVSFENDECVLKEVRFPYKAWTQVARVGCGGCHCSGAGSGIFDLTGNISVVDTYTLVLWCSERWGEEMCKFKFRIIMPDGTIREIENPGNYGDIEVIFSGYNITSYCESNPDKIEAMNFTPYNNWYSTDWWEPCDNCDFYAKVVFRVKSIDWQSFRLEIYGDDSAFAWIYANYTLKNIPDGASGVRAVCIDENYNVYAGMYGTKMMYYVDGDTGAVIREIDLSDVNCNPYGCIVDKNGLVWISCVAQNLLVKYNPKTGEKVAFPQGVPVYGITPTMAGDGVIFNGWTGKVVRKVGIDGYVYWSVTGPEQGRGITVDKEDFVYAVGSSYSDVWKYKPTGSLVKNVSKLCWVATGIGLDFYNYTWIACHDDNRIVMLDRDLNLLNAYTFGGPHYVYSDWTGYLLAFVAPPPPPPGPPAPPPVITAPPGEFFNLIPALLGNPLFFIIVFGLAVAAKIESMLRANGYAFIITFLGIIITYALFGGIINWWVILILIVLIIGGVMFFRKK